MIPFSKTGCIGNSFDHFLDWENLELTRYQNIFKFSLACVQTTSTTPDTNIIFSRVCK